MSRVFPSRNDTRDQVVRQTGKCDSRLELGNWEITARESFERSVLEANPPIETKPL